jgi:predicted phage terminase large subunit-like protein
MRKEKNTILVEDSVDAKDAAITFKSKFAGIRSIILVQCPGDKVSRCDPVEPIFEAGNVHLLKGPWNNIWLRGIRDFDGSGKTHDEMVDNLTCAYKHHCTPSGYKKLKDPFL